MTRTISTTWRRITVVATITTTALAMAAVLAASAHATVGITARGPYACSTAADSPKHVGWATLALRGCITPGMATTTECRSAAAYRWTGASWVNVGVNECATRSVYVYPYTTGWSWIWTQHTGWLAIQSHLVQVRAGYTPI